MERMKRAVVIGGGPAGLSAIRSLSKHMDQVEFVAYEISDKVGGTWIYNDEFKHSSLYKNMRTNVPKETMAYPDLPFSQDLFQSYITHNQVLDYIQDYAKHFQLVQHIKFRHKVIEVDTADATGSAGESKWKVTTQDEVTGLKKLEHYDAVYVCNGHYSTPSMPAIDGMSNYEGTVIHSAYYREPKVYTGQTVFVLGAGISGIDITLDLSPLAKKVYLGHNKGRLKSKLPDNVTETVGIRQLKGRNIELLDGTVVSADAIILATGYKFDFPFLSDRCKPTVEHGHVTNLYRMLVDIKHPSLFYIGLNAAIAPFLQFYLQSEYATALLLGKTPHVSTEEMIDEYRLLHHRLVKDLQRRDKDYHVLVKEYRWQYNRELASLAGLEYDNPALEALFDHSTQFRDANFCTYKNCVYRIQGKDSYHKIVLTERDCELAM